MSIDVIAMLSAKNELDRAQRPWARSMVVRRLPQRFREQHSRNYWQRVPASGWNSCRVMFFVCASALTVYAKVPVLPSEKVNVAVPTGVPVAPPGLPIGGKGTAWKGGPVSR